MEEIQAQDVDVAEKFSGVIRHVKLCIADQGSQGIRYLKDGTISACYELKVLAKQGDERLIGYITNIEINGIERILSVLKFLSHMRIRVNI